MIGLHNINEFIKTIKKAAVEAIEARKPCDVMFASVESVSPFEIKLTNSIFIPEELLIFTGETKQQFSIGDTAVLIRKAGGQKYLVIGVKT